jgi:hypothetical protein
MSDANARMNAAKLFVLTILACTIVVGTTWAVSNNVTLPSVAVINQQRVFSEKINLSLTATNTSSMSSLKTVLTATLSNSSILSKGHEPINYTFYAGNQTISGCGGIRVNTCNFTTNNSVSVYVSARLSKSVIVQYSNPVNLTVFNIQYTHNSSQSPSTVLPPGDSTYIFACGSGYPSIESTSFSNVESGYFFGCAGGSRCSATGYQASNIGSCSLAFSWPSAIAGIGLNVPVSDATIFSSANNPNSQTHPAVYDTNLTYTVTKPNSFVAIVGSCGWANCDTINLPTGCVMLDNQQNWYQASAFDAACIQDPGTYNVSEVSVGASICPWCIYSFDTAGVVSAYVFKD